MSKNRLGRVGRLGSHGIGFVIGFVGDMLGLLPAPKPAPVPATPPTLPPDVLAKIAEAKRCVILLREGVALIDHAEEAMGDTWPPLDRTLGGKGLLELRPELVECAADFARGVAAMEAGALNPATVGEAETVTLIRSMYQLLDAAEAEAKGDL